MLGIDSFGKKTLWRFQNCKDFHCECHRTKSTGKTKMFEWPGNQQDFWRHVFHDLLIWLWMRQEWTDTSYRFPQVSAALWRICRHIIGRLTIRDYNCQVSPLVSVWQLVRKSQVPVFFHSNLRTNQATRTVLSMERNMTNHLQDWFKQRFPCFSRYYGVNSEKSSTCRWLNFRLVSVAICIVTKVNDVSYTRIFQEKLDICYVTESLLIETSEVLQR